MKKSNYISDLKDCQMTNVFGANSQTGTSLNSFQVEKYFQFKLFYALDNQGRVGVFGTSSMLPNG